MTSLTYRTGYLGNVKRSPQSIPWFSAQETKNKTTKESDIRTKWPQLKPNKNEEKQANYYYKKICTKICTKSNARTAAQFFILCTLVTVHHRTVLIKIPLTIFVSIVYKTQAFLYLLRKDTRILQYFIFGWNVGNNRLGRGATSHHRIVYFIRPTHCGLLGPFHGAIAVPSVARCRRCRGHRCAGGARQYRQRHLVNGREVARSGEWAQHFSNASCLVLLLACSPPGIAVSSLWQIIVKKHALYCQPHAY